MVLQSKRHVRSAGIGLLYAVSFGNIVAPINIQWQSRETSRKACKLSYIVTVVLVWNCNTE
jgi:hypothetical protein